MGIHKAVKRPETKRGGSGGFRYTTTNRLILEALADGRRSLRLGNLLLGSIALVAGLVAGAQWYGLRDRPRTVVINEAPVLVVDDLNAGSIRVLPLFACIGIVGGMLQIARELLGRGPLG